MTETGETTKGGNIILRDVRAPDTVNPGDAFTVEADVDNGASMITSWDPDHCDEESLGYSLFVLFEGPNGEQVKKGPVCHGTTAVGSKRETYKADFTAPSTGDSASVKAKVMMRDSGKNTNWMSDRLVISRHSPTSPDSPTYDNPNNGSTSYPWENPGDDNNDGGNNPLSFLNVGDQLQGVGLLVVILIGVYLLVELSESGAEAASPI